MDVVNRTDQTRTRRRGLVARSICKMAVLQLQSDTDVDSAHGKPILPLSQGKGGLVW